MSYIRHPPDRKTVTGPSLLHNYLFWWPQPPQSAHRKHRDHINTFPPHMHAFSICTLEQPRDMVTQLDMWSNMQARTQCHLKNQSGLFRKPDGRQMEYTWDVSCLFTHLNLPTNSPDPQKHLCEKQSFPKILRGDRGGSSH